MTYLEWITYGIMQRYCTTAVCAVHEIDYQIAELMEEWGEPVDPEFGELDCVPSVVLLPPDEQDA